MAAMLAVKAWLVLSSAIISAKIVHFGSATDQNSVSTPGLCETQPLSVRRLAKRPGSNP